MTENQDDVLSFMGSDHENYSDIDELFGDKPRTRSVTEDTITNATNKRTRGMKRKAQTSCSASASAPPPRVTKQSKKSKTQSECVQEFNVDELKNQLGIDKILQSISSLTDTVKQLGSSNSMARNTCNVNDMRSTETTVRTSGNNSPGNFTQNVPNRPLRNLVNIPDYDSRQTLDETPDDFDFDFSYLNDQVSPSIEGVDPQESFKGILNDESIQITIDNNDWDIPQLNANEKTGPKVNEALGKAVNAAISIKSSKESMVDLEKKYDRPENCNLLKVPRVNKEIWDAMNKQAHSDDLTLQVIQKSLATGMIPLVQMADMLVNKKELEPHVCKKMLADSISMLGNAFYNVSMKRRNEIKNVLNFRYRKIASSEIPVTDHLFGDNCVSKLKEMGDITKQPIGMKSNHDTKFKNTTQAKNYMSNQGYQPIQNPYRGKNRQYSSYPSQRGRGQRGQFQYRSAMKKQYSYNK